MTQVRGKRKAMVIDILLHCLLLAVCRCEAMAGQLKLGGAGHRCLSQQGVSPGAEDAAAHGALCTVFVARSRRPWERMGFVCVP